LSKHLQTILMQNLVTNYSFLRSFGGRLARRSTSLPPMSLRYRLVAHPTMLIFSQVGGCRIKNLLCIILFWVKKQAYVQYCFGTFCWFITDTPPDYSNTRKQFSGKFIRWASSWKAIQRSYYVGTYKCVHIRRNTQQQCCLVYVAIT
jgi:hypothetical protein